MKLVLLSLLVALALTNVLGYPQVRIDQRIPGWSATGRINLAACRSRDFHLEYGQTHTESRGWCLLTSINALLVRGNKTVRARPYKSSGTAYAQFEIVQERPNDTSSICVRRINTNCS